jgi:hypothetical protein
MLMPAREQADLDHILAQVRQASTAGLPPLEERARYWLVGYRELERQQRVLTEQQRTELNAVVDRLAPAPRKTRQRQIRQRTGEPVILAVIIALTSILILVGVLGIRMLVTSGNGSPPAAGAPADPGQQPAPGALTDLQQFRADWNVPAGASASAGHPAQLVLLQNGLYYPAPWSVPAGDAGWVPDTTGTLAGQPAIHGNQADVTDSDGTAWTVAVGQPFVLAANPQVVLRVLRDAAVQSMPQPHAIAVRTSS